MTTPNPTTICPKCRPVSGEGCECVEPSIDIQKTLDAIDKDVFDCADAIQNALSCVGSRPDPVKAEEYLMDWVPKWMRDETFTPDQVPEKIRTDKVRNYIRQLESEHRELASMLRRMVAESERMKEDEDLPHDPKCAMCKATKISKQVLSSLTLHL